MATKACMHHVNDILINTTHHKLLDVYFVLCNMSTQDSNNQFFIHTASKSIYSVCKAIMKEAPYMKSRNTIHECCKELMSIGILKYNREAYAWELHLMKYMFKSDNGLSGFIHLRKIFFTELFYNLSVSEKKILCKVLSIMSSKGYRSYRDIEISLENDKDKVNMNFWKKGLNSNDKYYIRKIIAGVLSNKELFIDNSDTERQKQLIKHQFNSTMYKKQKKLFQYRFWFSPAPKLRDLLYKNKKSLEERFNDLKQKYKDLYDYLSIRLLSCQDYIQKKFSMEIWVAILSSCRNVSWIIRKEVVEGVITKLYHHVEIASPEKFIGSLTRSRIQLRLS